uniref:Glucosylceramidase n=1 Tax=Timema poppense TaxID=170557 RepID=A0A7R9D9V8_TIMPO|nr:unnamed protein product [Timema poppensis]
MTSNNNEKNIGRKSLPTRSASLKKRPQRETSEKGSDVVRHNTDWVELPNIKRAQSLSNGKVKLFTTAWSAPDWMKNIQTNGLSSLKPEYYQLWADYYIK